MPRFTVVALVPLLVGLVHAAAAAQSAPVTTGVVRAHDETILQSEMGGMIERILVKEGELVKEGQALVQLRNDRQKIALDVARADMARTEAQVSETRVLLDSARKELQRISTAGDALPRKEFEDRQDAVQRLTATLTAHEAERARASQEVRFKEQELKETTLVAPFAGAVTQIKAHRGDTLRSMETPVLELVDLDHLYVEVLMPEATAHRLRIGQIVNVRVEREWMGRAGQIRGRVSYISQTVDAAS